MSANSFTDKEIIDALRTLKNSPKPMLVHCLHGSDRTGVVIAMYRILFENWTKEQALDELQHGGYGFHEKYTNIIRYVQKADTEKLKTIVLN
jgi:protein tyrosine/serine phosphatase